jgi:hypothetical protein
MASRSKNAPVTCKIGDIEFTAAEATYVMDASSTSTGAFHHEKPIISAYVRIDLNDKSCDFATIRKLFDLTKLPTTDSIKQIKLEQWVDLSDKNATCSYSFKGWISSYRTSYLGRSGGNYNHVIDLVLIADTTDGSFAAITIGN